MLRILKIILALFFSIYLTACAGTGNTYLNKSELNNTSSNNKVFVYREKAFEASGNVPAVFYNNKKIGSLGSGEYLSTGITASINNIEVKSTGLMGIGMYGVIKSFDNKSNKYFLVKYKNSLLTAGWEMIEISRTQFESYF